MTENEETFNELFSVLRDRVKDPHDLKVFGSVVMVLMGVTDDEGRIVPERLVRLKELLTDLEGKLYHRDD